MLPFPCSKCEHKKKYNCTIPNTAASLNYTIGDADSGIIGVNFFEQDNQADAGEDSKAMYMLPVKAGFKKPKISEKNKLHRNSEISNLPPITTDDNNYSIEISNLLYKNTPDSADGSIVIKAVIGCKKLKKKYMVNLTASWDFEEVQDEEAGISE